jgi:hypothetical protein
MSNDGLIIENMDMFHIHLAVHIKFHHYIFLLNLPER